MNDSDEPVDQHDTFEAKAKALDQSDRLTYLCTVMLVRSHGDQSDRLTMLPWGAGSHNKHRKQTWRNVAQHQ